MNDTTTKMKMKITPDDGLEKGRAYIDHISPMVVCSARTRKLPPRLTALCLRALADAIDPPRRRRVRKFPDLPDLMDA